MEGMAVYDPAIPLPPPVEPPSSPLTEPSAKRRKLEDHSPLSTLEPSHQAAPPSGSSTRPLTVSASLATASPALPLAPSLYHLGISAHHSASLHLQQAFIPPSVDSPSFDSEYAPISARDTAGERPDYARDNLALHKALGLLFLALDSLRAGFRLSELSDREKVAFGTEFGVVALKVMAMREVSLPPNMGKVYFERIAGDARDVIGDSMSIAGRYSYLRPSLQQLELLDARLSFTTGRTKAARRAVLQCIASAPKSEHAHRYSLFLLLLQHAHLGPLPEAYKALDLLTIEAKLNNHTDIEQLSHLIRLRLLFEHRQWHNLPTLLASLPSSIENAAERIDPNTPPWTLYYRLHCLTYRCLLEARTGNDTLVRAILKRLYSLMDQAADLHLWKQLREDGGEHRFNLNSAPGSQFLNVQLTPPNIMYLMTYVATSTSRRDYLGAAATCRGLMLPRALRETADVARAEDIWDANFSLSHGPADAIQLQRHIISMRVEIMLEEATALLCRSANTHADQILTKALDLATRHDIFDPLAPHFCFVHAQLAHALGRNESASRLYRACAALILPGSEFGMLVQIGQLASEGRLLHLDAGSSTHKEISDIVERCQTTANASLSGAAYFLASLLEPNRMASKNKLSKAYEIAQKSNNNILRALIFAFTTSAHVYGTADKTLKQLETGRDIARLMGLVEKTDIVGQLPLGLWFAEKLKEYYRREANADLHAVAKASQQEHLRRLEVRKSEVPRIKHNASS